MTRSGLIQNADHLKQASPLVHWPPGLEPRNVDVFIHNEGWIDASPDIVWANLIDASQWPSWYSNSADLRIEGGQPQLGMGVSFNWKTFGFPIRSTVDAFDPGREIGWSVDNPVFMVHHGWVLVRSSSTSSSRTRCMMVISLGCPR